MRSSVALFSAFAKKNPTTRRRVLRMRGLPRGWMHDEVTRFVDHVALQIHASEPESSGLPQGEAEGEEGGGFGSPAAAALTSSSLSSSRFVSRVRIPFGRKTGVVIGIATVELNSDEVAEALLALRLDNEFDDSRRRIRFEEIPLDDVQRHEKDRQQQRDAEEQEDAQALETLELDRYLLDPDLLYNLKKGRQRRLLTRNEEVRLPSFLNNDTTVAQEGREGEAGDVEAERGGDGLDDEVAVKVADLGDSHEIGRGSMQNLGLPVPYVQGRRGF